MSQTGIRIPKSNESFFEDPDEKDCLPKWVIEAPTKKERSLNFLGFQYVLILKNDPADPKNHILNLISNESLLTKRRWQDVIGLNSILQSKVLSTAMKHNSESTLIMVVQ